MDELPYNADHSQKFLRPRHRSMKESGLTCPDAPYHHRNSVAAMPLYRRDHIAASAGSSGRLPKTSLRTRYARKPAMSASTTSRKDWRLLKPMVLDKSGWCHVVKQIWSSNIERYYGGQAYLCLSCTRRRSKRPQPYGESCPGVRST